MRTYQTFPLTVIVAGTALGFGWVAASTSVFPATSILDLIGARNLSNSENPSDSALVASAPGTLHVVWVETIFGWPDIYHTFRNAGLDWSAPIRVESGTQPDLATGADGPVDLVWLDESELGGSFDAGFIRYRRWDESLRMWVDAYNVAVGSLGTLQAPAVAVGPGDMSHVVWVDSVGGSPRIRYRRRSGPAWGSPENVAFGRDPDITVDLDGSLHLVWTAPSLLSDHSEIHYRWRDLNGRWSLTYVISDRPAVDAVDPALAVDENGKVHVSWREIAGDSEAVRYRFGRRSAWPSPVEMAAPLMSHAGPPAIAVDRTRHVYLVFASQGALQYRVRQPTMQAWEAGVSIAAGQSAASSPGLTVEMGGMVHVVWTGPGVAGQTDIFHQAVEPGLQATQTPTAVATTTPVVSLTPAVTPAATSTPTIALSPTMTWTPEPTRTATVTPTASWTPRPQPTVSTGRKFYLPLALRLPTWPSGYQTIHRRSGNEPPDIKCRYGVLPLCKA